MSDALIVAKDLFSIISDTRLVALFYMKGLKLAREAEEAEEEITMPLDQNTSQSDIDRNFSRNLKEGLKSMMRFAMAGTLEKIYEDLETFRAFVHFAMSAAVTRGTWRLVRARKCVSQIFTEYDEALALALLDNSCIAWNSLNNAVDEGTGAPLLRTKYICYNIKVGNKTGLKRGWSVKGVTQYNKFVALVKRVRLNRTAMENQTCEGYRNMINKEGEDNSSLTTGSEGDMTITHVQAECGIEL